MVRKGFSLPTRVVPKSCKMTGMMLKLPHFCTNFASINKIKLQINLGVAEWYYSKQYKKYFQSTNFIGVVSTAN